MSPLALKKIAHRIEEWVPAEGESFRIHAEFDGAELFLKFVGRINEEVSFENLMTEVSAKIGAGAGTLVFDLAEVVQINSCGMRDWLLFLEKVQFAVPVRFKSVSEAFIEQATIVPPLLGKHGTPVDEFETPYFCKKCDLRVVRTVKLEQLLVPVVGGEIHAPVATCLQCNEPLEFDADEEEYFSFVRHTKT